MYYFFLCFMFFSYFIINMEFSNIFLNLNNISIYMNNNIYFYSMTVLIIFLSVKLFSYYYLNSNKNYLYFIMLFILFFLSMLILLNAESILVLFLGWDGLGITSFILVNFYKNWNTFNNSMLTFMSNRVGDILFMLIFSYMLFITKNYYIISFLFIFLIITKSAQFPFMSWLPAAMAAPTPVSALVHSSTLVTAGIFIMSKFIFTANMNSIYLLFILSMLTIILSGFMAIFETDFKKMVAFSTLSQMGFLLLMLSNMKIILCYLHLFSHAFFKSMLFINVGSLLHSSNNSQDSRSFMKNINNNKSSFFILIICIFNLMGLFFLSGFWSKDLFLMFPLFNMNLFSKFCLYFMISLTIFYSLKMFYFIKNFSFFSLKEMSISLNFSMFFLFLLSCFFILYFYENYLYFFENYLYFFENYLYLLFTFIMMIIFNLNFLKFNNILYLMMNLLFFNNKMLLLMSNNYKKMEKMILDKLMMKMFNFNMMTNMKFLLFILMLLLFFMI